MGEVSGGEVIARMLRAEGVDRVFGIIDGTYFGFYSQLRPNGMELVTPRHETSAAHMAGAYARLTGRLGVCMASNGPGVANLLPGLVVEEGEGNRVLAITSARRTGIMYPGRPGAYQRFDQTGTIGHFAKWSQAVPSFGRIPEILRAALRQCWEGRPGVVHVDVPEDIMNKRVKADTGIWEPFRYRRVEPVQPDPSLVDRAAELLLAADAPLIHAGSGVVHAQAYDELREVAELLRSPVTTSWGARGAVPENLDVSLPMIYVKLTRLARTESDVVLVLGSRLGETDMWGRAPFWRRPSEQKTIQVDIDGGILGAHKPVDVAVLGDVRVFLRELLRRLHERRAEIRTAARDARLARYWRHLRRYRSRLDRPLQDRAVPMNTAHVPRACRDVFPEDSVLVADGGNSAVWSQFYHEMRVPGTLLSTFKFGMLGAGVAQAIGAAVARPGRPVCCIVGDGAMGFHPQEIETAVRHRLPVVYVVVCDGQWGMVKMSQSFALKPWKMLLRKRLEPGETFAADLGEIQFHRLAESMGAYGERVADPAELRPALLRCLAAGGPAVLHVDVNPVAHMWAPGLAHFREMHLEPAGR